MKKITSLQGTKHDIVNCKLQFILSPLCMSFVQRFHCIYTLQIRACMVMLIVPEMLYVYHFFFLLILSLSLSL